MKILYTNQFKRDYKRIKKQNKNLDKLRTVIEKLVTREALDQKYRDHPLIGKLKGFRDCHLEARLGPHLQTHCRHFNFRKNRLSFRAV